MVAKILSSYRLASLEQTIKQLNQEDCLIIAGGTDVMVLHKNRRGVPPKITKPVIFIDHLSELKQVYAIKTDLHIGACCTYSELLQHPLIPKVLKKAIKEIAAPAIRNRGTIGGNICNASPAGDTLPLLYIYNTKLVLRSGNGDRLVEIKDFIQGPRRVQRFNNEILVEVILPSALENDPQIIFEKIANRRADAIAKISFAGYLHVQNEVISEARFAFGAVGPTIVRSLDIEQILYSKAHPLDNKLINTIIKEYGNLIHPIDDQRSTAIYRKTVALKLLRYFLETKGM